MEANVLVKNCKHEKFVSKHQMENANKMVAKCE